MVMDGGPAYPSWQWKGGSKALIFYKGSMTLELISWDRQLGFLQGIRKAALAGRLRTEPGTGELV